MIVQDVCAVICQLLTMYYDQVAKKLYNCEDVDEINEVFDTLLGEDVCTSETRKVKMCMQTLINNVKDPFELLMNINPSLFMMTCERVNLGAIDMTQSRFVSLLNRNVTNTYELLRRYYDGRFPMNEIEMFKISDNEVVARTFMYMNNDDSFTVEQDSIKASEEFVAKLLIKLKNAYTNMDIASGDHYLATSLSCTALKERVLDTVVKNRSTLKSKNDTVIDLNLIQLRYTILHALVTSGKYVPSHTTKHITEKTVELVSEDDEITITDKDGVAKTEAFKILVDLTNVKQSFVTK